MSATDYIGGVYAAIWALLEAHTRFTDLVKPGNRIKLNGDDANPFKDVLQDGDLPQVVVGLGDGEDSLFTTTPQYDYTAAAVVANLQWKELISQVYTITHITGDLRIGQSNPLTHEILTALRKGGPRLGLAYVHSIGPARYGHRITATGADESGNPTGTRRLVVTITLSVAFAFDGQTLLG